MMLENYRHIKVINIQMTFNETKELHITKNPQTRECHTEKHVTK
jgi:hypothetical protein